MRDVVIYDFRYRIVCLVSIVEKLQQALNYEMKFSLDPKTDNFTIYRHEMATFYIVVVVVMVFKDWNTILCKDKCSLQIQTEVEICTEEKRNMAKHSESSRSSQDLCYCQHNGKSIRTYFCWVFVTTFILYCHIIVLPWMLLMVLVPQKNRKKSIMFLLFWKSLWTAHALPLLHTFTVLPHISLFSNLRFSFSYLIWFSITIIVCICFVLSAIINDLYIFLYEKKNKLEFGIRWENIAWK